MFLPLYVNPKYTSDARWKSLADLLRWTRERSGVIAQAVPLLPVAWQGEALPQFTDQAALPRQPYGYAHGAPDSGLVALRNPWIAPQAYRLVLDDRLGFPREAADLDAISLYPEPREYGKGLKFGDALEIPLAPYETVVLSIRAGQSLEGLPSASSAIGSQVAVTRSNCGLQRVAFSDSQGARGPDWTSPLGDAASAVRVTLNADVTVTAPRGELLILCEGAQSPAGPVGRLTVNDRDVAARAVFSAAGWSATLLPHHEHWLFLRVPLDEGENRIVGELFASSDSTDISAWVWATRPGGAGAYPGSLPQPETISLDGAALLDPVAVSELPPATERIERPVERILGLFLDLLEPISVTQGWGTLQRNQSVWEKPMVIGGKPFARGLGTHAPSKIVYALEGKFRRFQSWVGADANTSPTITFEVRVDGVKRWESELMTRESPPVWIDLDVSGARMLELVVGDAGSLPADHADWAEARLLY